MLVDWETAGLGLRCWDTGTVISEFLAEWLISAPVSKNIEPEEFTASARFPLEHARDSIRAFWNSYKSCLLRDGSDSRELLADTLRLAGIRLVQTAFERLQNAQRLSSEGVFLLQLAANLATVPFEIAASFAGLTDEP
jgi:hypothetical protein